jgi:hypothetical protein
MRFKMGSSVSCTVLLLLSLWQISPAQSEPRPSAQVKLQISGLTVVHGALSIPSADGVVVRHATGIEDTDNKGYGDAVSNANAMAFKRAFAMFGLARHLYQK